MDPDGDEYYITYQQLSGNHQLAKTSTEAHSQHQQPLAHLSQTLEEALLDDGDTQQSAYGAPPATSENPHIFNNQHGVLSHFCSQDYSYNTVEAPATSHLGQVEISSSLVYENHEQQLTRHASPLNYCHPSPAGQYVLGQELMESENSFINKQSSTNYTGPLRGHHTQHVLVNHHQQPLEYQQQQFKLQQPQSLNSFISMEEFQGDSEKMSGTDGCGLYETSHFRAINSDQMYYDETAAVRSQLDYPMQAPPIQSKLANHQRQELYPAARSSGANSTLIDSLGPSGFVSAQQHIYQQHHVRELLPSYQSGQANLSTPPATHDFHHQQNASAIFYAQAGDSSSCQSTAGQECAASPYGLGQPPPPPPPSTTYFQQSISPANYQTRQPVAGSSSCVMFKPQESPDQQQVSKFQLSCRHNAQMVSHQRQHQQQPSVEESAKRPCSAAPLASAKQPEDLVNLKSCASLSQEWLDTICRHLIEHMNQFGICVIDNFLGSSKGNSILREVQKLYDAGQYTKGRLVSSKLSPKSHINEAATSSIRNDRVIWIDGCEEGCEEINNLIQTLCSVIMNSSRLALYSNKGLDKVVISKRTKAHVACYPGDGTRYIKHVDNPNGDGRVITAIYYLNKNWLSRRDGGLLRMFPVGMDEVANIEPLFDRVLFFWSDRRNPHEVLPAFRDRFAITVWYIGETRT